jgi:hypothetical protein
VVVLGAVLTDGDLLVLVVPELPLDDPVVAILLDGFEDDALVVAAVTGAVVKLDGDLVVIDGCVVVDC